MPFLGQDFSVGDRGELKSYGMDFGAVLAVGETISSMTPTITLVLGVDATPSSHLSGAPSISGTKAFQTFDWSGSALDGNRYAIAFLITTSTGQKFQAWSYVSIQVPG